LHVLRGLAAWLERPWKWVNVIQTRNLLNAILGITGIGVDGKKGAEGCCGTGNISELLLYQLTPAIIE